MEERSGGIQRRLGNGLRLTLDRYFLLLVMILVTIAASAVLVPESLSAVVLVGLQSSTALLAVSTSESSHLTRVTVRLIVAISVALVALSVLFGDRDLARISYTAGTLVLVGVVPVTVLRRLARHRRVTTQTVMGVLCIYLLVGLLFSVFFSTYQHFAGPFFTTVDEAGPSDFIYFSFVTITTVGYSDLVPRDQVARVLAITEALIGQLYLVTIVALTVGNIGLDHTRPNDA